MGFDPPRSRESKHIGKGMLTKRHEAKDSGERSPFSSFRQRWMNNDHGFGLSTEKRRGLGDFSREDERRSLTTSFLKNEKRDVACRSTTNDFFRRHNTQKSRLSDSSKLIQSFTGDRASKIGSTGFSRFRQTDKFESTITTDKGKKNEILKTRGTEITESSTRRYGGRTVQSAKGEETSVLRRDVEISSENTTMGRGNIKERGFARSMFEKSTILNKEGKQGISKIDSPAITRKSYEKSVETTMRTTTSSEISAEKVENEPIDSKVTHGDNDLLRTKKVPPNVIRKPVPKSPIILCNEDDVRDCNSPGDLNKQVTDEVKATESNDNDSPCDSTQRPSVSSLRNSLFGGDSTAFAAIAARGMGGTLAPSPVTLRARHSVERRQVVSTTEITENGSIARSVYRMERKSESEVEICRDESALLPTLYTRFEKPKRKNIAVPSREFRRSQLEITDGNETGDTS